MVASGGGREMPTNGHNWCPEPTEGTHQSAILPELLWHWPRVSVLHGPLPGSWPDGSFVDTTYIELLSYGLLHLDHGQYLCSWSDSPESLTAESAHYRAQGHVATSHYGELAGNCRRRPGPQTTDPTANASHSWSPTDETSDASTAGAYSRRAGSDASNTLSTTGVPT